MKQYEPVSRVREEGRKVYAPATCAERITAFRLIVEAKSFAIIDGATVDLFSASAVVQVYDALSSTEAKVKFSSMSAAAMVDLAFKVIAKAQGGAS